MKNISLFVILILSLFACKSTTDPVNQNIVTSDIDHFWIAYDKIVTTEDTLLKEQFLEELFLSKGSVGLKSMIRARNYTKEEYLRSIKNYPNFWSSIREDTYKGKELSKELEIGVEKLGILYPDLKPAKIYFTMGALRSNGTTMDSLVLIGSELAFATKSTPTDELPDNLSHLRSFFDSEPSENIVFLNIHEYVHTQQKITIGNNLLAQTVLEGVAEFVAEKALDITSPNPQIQYGRDNDARVKAKFELEMFSPNIYNWIWNSADNEFGMRDLAYYIGYKICESYYATSDNKAFAIKQMIELDYNDESKLIDFVEKSRYFSKPLTVYKDSFEESRPTVVGLESIENKDSKVSPSLNVLTINFSKEMDTRYRNFELGPLGEGNLLRLKDFLGFAKDGKSLSFRLGKLEAGRKYQIVVGSGFRDMDGIPLVPYLIEFETNHK